MKKLLPLICCAAAMLLAAGCSTYVQKVALLDEGVLNSVKVNDMRARKSADGRLEVTANLRNLENRRIQVQVNCVFKDNDGFPTEGEAPFENLILTENAQESVTFIAMNDKAQKYTLRVRQAR